VKKRGCSKASGVERNRKASLGGGIHGPRSELPWREENYSLHLNAGAQQRKERGREREEIDGDKEDSWPYGAT